MIIFIEKGDLSTQVKNMNMFITLVSRNRLLDKEDNTVYSEVHCSRQFNFNHNRKNQKHTVVTIRYYAK